MVAFNDRRSVALGSSWDAPGLSSGSGVSLSRKVINGAFVISSRNVEDGRVYAVHETLASGETLTRDDNLPTRYAARKSAMGMEPSNVREI